MHCLVISRRQHFTDRKNANHRALANIIVLLHQRVQISGIKVVFFSWRWLLDVLAPTLEVANKRGLVTSVLEIGQIDHGKI